jgi:hypothetical protein
LRHTAWPKPFAPQIQTELEFLRNASSCCARTVEIPLDHHLPGRTDGLDQRIARIELDRALRKREGLGQQRAKRANLDQLHTKEVGPARIGVRHSVIRLEPAQEIQRLVVVVERQVEQEPIGPQHAVIGGEAVGMLGA